MPSDLEAAFLHYWRALAPGAPEPVAEYRGIPGRRFRFDYAWPDAMVAVEVHGATYARGRHTRGAGFRRDREKMNAATALGWRVFELTADMLTDDPVRWIGQVREAVDDA